eukprot:scaffold145139_cov163-Phaeocystis_antarctica.AAC.1
MPSRLVCALSQGRSERGLGGMHRSSSRNHTRRRRRSALTSSRTSARQSRRLRELRGTRAHAAPASVAVDLVAGRRGSRPAVAPRVHHLRPARLARVVRAAGVVIT